MKSDSTQPSEISVRQDVVSGTNHDVAIRLLYEGQIEELEKFGRLKKGELVVKEVEGKLAIVSTSGRSVYEIIKEAHPDHVEEVPKLSASNTAPIKMMYDEQRPTNRAERRASKRKRR